MKTDIWGPSTWTFLHAVSFAYPDEPTEDHKNAAVSLFESLKFLLPCGDCCMHYCTVLNIKELTQAVESKDKFSRWVVDFHNTVNARLKKPIFPYHQAEKKYLTEDAQCEVQAPCSTHLESLAPEAKPFQDKKNYFFVYIGVLAAIVLFLLLRYNK